MKIFVENLGDAVTVDDGDRCCTGVDVANAVNMKGPSQAIAMVVDGVLCDISAAVADGASVRFLDFSDDDGVAKKIFWHTSAHILAQAVLRVFPEAKIAIGPAIDEGFYYDFGNVTICERDLATIESAMRGIIKENYRLERIASVDVSEALSVFRENSFKREIVEGIDGEITIYRQGDFVDICRGPHLVSTGKVKAFKLLKVSGAYWRGDQSREQLQRVYGISFPSKELLKDFVLRHEEAKKRDHKILGPRLNLFATREEAPGMAFILPEGIKVWNALINFWKTLHDDYGYREIKTPTIMSQSLWEKSGHWANYKENMYYFGIEDRNFSIKPMNCPGCILHYLMNKHSYKELPLRVAEMGQVFRHEPSGAVSGLFRVRSFYLDDAHIFMTPEDIEHEVYRVFELLDEIYSAFDLDYSLELSTKPEGKTIGSEESWRFATNALEGALKSWGRQFKVNEGDGAFYGPKIDAHVKDSLGRSWQCGTIQLDMNLPERFGIEYVDSKGNMATPLMIHRAIYGSLERFFGILIEHYKGRFPLWLSPKHVRVITVADRHKDYAKEILGKMKGFFCDVDDSDNSISKKVRNGQVEQINYLVIVGDAEVDGGVISVRCRDSNRVFEGVNVADFIDKISQEKSQRSSRSPHFS